jgi:type VI secretion system protein ImpJ
MKFLSRVVWSEGMHLGPHHFQSQNRYFEDSLRFTMEHTWFEPWGLLSYNLDHDAIKNGRVALSSALGMFEDGLAFDMPGCDELPVDRDIRDLFSPTADHLIVYLAVPAGQLSTANNDISGAQGAVRFRTKELLIRDLNDSSDEKPVQFGQKNIRLAVTEELNPNLVAIPLARVKRDGFGSLVYDPEFIPPCLKITGSDRLMASLVRLVEVLQEKRKTLISSRARLSSLQSSASQAEVSNFWFLHTINHGLAALRHLYLTKRCHPEELFRELLQIAGGLCTFNVESDPAALPMYEHRRLQECFGALMEHIHEHLEIMVPAGAIEVVFKRTERNFFSAELVDPRCLNVSRWILGVRSSAGEAELLTRGAQLVKMCSRAFVPELVKRAMPGLVLSPLNVPPSAVPVKMEMQYFNVSKAGPCWNHIMDSKQVGIYIPNELPEPKIELYVIPGN